MQSNERRKAIIIGAGIGGITAAIALRQAGLDVSVFERADELREVGSGLPLWSNALNALRKLSLAATIEKLGSSVTAGSLTTWRGDVLSDLRTEELLQRLGTINMVVHRAELLAALVAVLGGEHIHLGTTYTGFTQDSDHVYAHFANGQQAQADLLIGADGLHSLTRTQLFGSSQPRYAGYVCWRGVAHISRPNLETWAWGKGRQFGITPMSNNRAYWFAQYYAPENTPLTITNKKAEMLRLFHDWHDPIPAVIEATAEPDILCNDVYESPLLRHWSNGHVSLLGDAAHTMTPNLGQGACQAIEDAVVLGACLKACTDIISALKLYETRRIRRTNTLTRLARLIGQIVQIDNPLVCAMRNTFMRTIPVSSQVKRLMWILEYDVYAA